MSANVLNHMDAHTNRHHGRRSRRGQPPATERVVWDLRVFQSNPFGPQSQWSSLLCERELLQDEIVRGQKYLLQLRGEGGPGSVPWQVFVGYGVELREGPPPTTPGPSSVADNLELSLRDWIQRLEERLEAVTHSIETAPGPSVLRAQRAEEPVFTLLRAAG
jgi:hypothetical protein